MADFFFRPARDFFIFFDAIPNHEWLGYLGSWEAGVDELFLFGIIFSSPADSCRYPGYLSLIVNI